MLQNIAICQERCTYIFLLPGQEGENRNKLDSVEYLDHSDMLGVSMKKLQMNELMFKI